MNPAAAMTTPHPTHLRPPGGFSLVEVLAAVAIIGIVAFLAIPNIVAIKRDSEQNLAISRAEAVNMAVVSYIQAHGRNAVAADWSTKDNQQRYAAVTPFLSFAPPALSDYVPGGYQITLPADLNALNKAVLVDLSTETEIPY